MLRRLPVPRLHILGCTFYVYQECFVNLKEIQLTWLGHATFRVQTSEGKTLYVDPWIAGNPKCPEGQTIS